MLARVTELTRRIRGLLRDLWKEKAPPPLTPKEIGEIRNTVASIIGRNLYLIYRLESDVSCLVLAVREYIDAMKVIHGVDGTLDSIEPAWDRRDRALVVIQTYLDAWEGEE